ncbi:MAG: ABC transporter ATP-binding protein, partial [Corynebacterium sphenisci]|nr:ABC transporter ATP-binding protein [Corynebacterium sphenisci]
ALAAAGLAPAAGAGAGGALVVPAPAAEVGRAALAGGVALTELTAVGGGLEEAFMELTGSAVDYRGGAA